ncbi:MAG: hypothetical protein LBM08_03905 [Dysgonamonadaceae bacterium]|jgi:hypothetical protein|nr:hypothetical protein [Dysgonamonadaceae bacterium]
MTVINGRQYEFADLALFLGGRDVTGFRGIKYTSTQEKEVLYGKGNRGMSIQKGNIAHEGEISLTQSEFETLKLLGGGSVLNLNLNAVVCYGNPAKGDMLITDKISGIQFTEEAKEISQGDKFMEVTLPFIALDIQYQAA